MKKVPYILAAMVMAGYLGVTHAEEATTPAPQPNPMMYGPGPQGQAMPPYMRDRMMHMRQHRQMMMQQQAAQGTDPSARADTMPMPPGPMARGAHVCHHEGGKGMRSVKMNMIRERMEKMETHMKNVDEHLTNIEALLKEMLEKM